MIPVSTGFVVTKLHKFQIPLFICYLIKPAYQKKRRLTTNRFHDPNGHNTTRHHLAGP